MEAKESSGSFPLASIPELETSNQYTRWRQRIDDFLVLNSLDNAENDKKRKRATTCIKTRLGYNARAIVESITNDPDACLKKIEDNYKPKGSGVYTELVRRLHSISLAGEKSVEQYTQRFREVDTELKAFDAEATLPEAYLIQLYFIGLGDAYSIFHTTFAQTHKFFGTEKTSFDEVTLAARNEEQRLNSSQTNVSLFANKRKASQSTRTAQAHGQANKGACKTCKGLGRSANHKESDCYAQHPEKAPAWFKEKYGSPTKKPKVEDSSEGYVTFGDPNDSGIEIKGTGSRNHANFSFLAGDLSRQMTGLFIVDGGASQHMICNRNAFVDLKPFVQQPTLGIAGAEVAPIGIGTVSLQCRVGSHTQEVRIPRCLYAPKAGVNLISESQLLDSGVQITTARKFKSLSYGGVMLQASRWGGLFALDLAQNVALQAYSVPQNPLMRQWHERLGHVAPQTILKAEKLCTGVDLKRKRGDDNPPEGTCTSCVAGRMKASPHWTEIRPADEPLELIHSDLMEVKNGYDGSRYIVTFRCGFTGFAEVYPLKYKEETFNAFLTFKNFHEKNGRKIRRIHCDGGGEFLNGDFERLARQGVRSEPLPQPRLR